MNKINKQTAAFACNLRNGLLHMILMVRLTSIMILSCSVPYPIEGIDGKQTIQNISSTYMSLIVLSLKHDYNVWW